MNYNEMATVEVFPSSGDLADAFLHRLALDILKEAGNGNDYHIALSGGSTPLEIFQRTPSGWGSQVLLRRMKLYWGDERCVPPGSDQSNYGNAQREWFSRITVPGSNIHRIHGEDDPETEARRYEAELRKLPARNGLPCFDLVMLGVGEDGHTASIFPGYMDLMSSGRLVAVTKHPGSGQNRITLTGPVLNNARHVLFLATGSRKEKILRDIFSDTAKAQEYPAYHIRPKGRLSWYLDSAAGSWYAGS